MCFTSPYIAKIVLQITVCTINSIDKFYEHIKTAYNRQPSIAREERGKRKEERGKMKDERGKVKEKGGEMKNSRASAILNFELFYGRIDLLYNIKLYNS